MFTGRRGDTDTLLPSFSLEALRDGGLRWSHVTLSLDDPIMDDTAKIVSRRLSVTGVDGSPRCIREYHIRVYHLIIG